MGTVEFLWTEKYRPKLLDDCILPESLKKTFKAIVSGGELHNLLLTGTAGLGKTTVARALCNELNLDYIVINGSEESGIDTLRSKIRSFASTVSLGNDGPKVVILDEADYLNPQSTQPALRGFIEEFSSNCRFILTCNFKNRIIEPLHSRCSVVEFNSSKTQLVDLCGQFHRRLIKILQSEGVKFDVKVLVEVILKHAPDWRRILNECQRYAASGEIDSGLLVNLGDTNIGILMKSLKEKDFKSMRTWVTNNVDSEPAAIFRKIFDSASEYAKPTGVPQVVLILAEYQYKHAFVADHELNLVACLTELMASVEWK
jgi:DNA polymerase III delta prime subunit